MTQARIEQAWSNVQRLMAAKRLTEALSACDAAIAELPGAPGFHLLKAACLLELRRYAETVQAIDGFTSRGWKATPETYVMQAHALWRLGREQDAVGAMAKAIAADPSNHHAHEIHGRFSLALGDFDAGWRGYEHRFARLRRMRSDIAQWSGQDLTGRKVLAIAEQGLGDTIQFGRFLPLLRERGASVTAVVQPAVLPILRASDPEIAWGSEFNVAGAFDFRVDMMSLPLLLGTGASTLADRVPYLRADPARVAGWRTAIGDRGFKVGIAWQGSVGSMRDDERSLPLPLFQAMAQIPGVRLISIQGMNGLEQLANLPPELAVERLGPKIESNPDGLAEVAAVMAGLDLIVTSDSATAHLAGALGRPVWIGLKQDADWRWMRGRSDSPWYPTARLFRQQAAGEWRPVFAEMTALLADQASRSG